MKLLGVYLFMLLLGTSGLYLLSTCFSPAHLESAPRSASQARWPEPPARRRTEKLLQELRLNGTSPCHQSRTTSFRIVNLHKLRHTSQRPIRIYTDTPTEFMLVSITENGTARCAGGDFYELELAGDRWRSRPPITDHGNGSYTVSILVDGAFPGVYNFTANLLFYNYHGLELNADEWAVQPRREISKSLKLQLVAPAASGSNEAGVVSSQLRQCTRQDMRHRDWKGRWTRSWFNRSCTPGPDGRFDACTPAAQASCSEPWCSGRVALLESNGWVYSAHCAFRIWERDEAWDCLAGRRLFFWGDSNMQDFVRNLVAYALGFRDNTTCCFGRLIEQLYINPRRPDQAVHISLVFNGHHQIDSDFLGLDSLSNPTYRAHLLTKFTDDSSRPDAFIFGSGLHDGKHFTSLDAFVDSIEQAVTFWQSVFGGMPPRDIVLHTPITPAGDTRYKQSNPHKMDVYSTAMIERFQRLGELLVVDAFDSTFPFHFDTSCSDGWHYGKEPNANLWPWYGEPHQYFVELMLVHMMLTSICPSHD